MEWVCAETGLSFSSNVESWRCISWQKQNASNRALEALNSLITANKEPSDTLTDICIHCLQGSTTSSVTESGVLLHCLKTWQETDVLFHTLF